MSKTLVHLLFFSTEFKMVFLFVAFILSITMSAQLDTQQKILTKDVSITVVIPEGLHHCDLVDRQTIVCKQDVK